MMKTYAIFLAVLLSGFGIAQQSTRISQFMFSPMLINPATAGQTGGTTFGIGLKSMWNGVPGAPNTQFATVEGTTFRKKIGWGVELQNDQAALLNQRKVVFNGSWRTRTGMNSYFAVGGGFGLRQHVFDGSQASAFDMVDDAIPVMFVSVLKPVSNLGAFWYTPRYHVGASVENAMAYKIDYTNEARPMVSRAVTRINLSGGVQFQLSPLLAYKQYFFVKVEPNNPTQIDITPTIVYNQQLTFGMGYRHQESVSFIFQYQLNQQFKGGYAYDYQMNGLNQVSNGSHELFLAYSIGQSKPVFNNPRYF